MNTEFDMQIDAKDLYKFNIRQTYLSFNGVLSVVLPIICIIMAVLQAQNNSWIYFALYLGFGILFIFYMPLSLWLGSKRIMKMGGPITKKLHYVMSEESIQVSVEDQKDELPWNLVYRMIETKETILIFSNRKNAFILKKDQLGTAEQEVKELAKKKLEKFRLKLQK